MSLHLKKKNEVRGKIKSKLIKLHVRLAFVDTVNFSSSTKEIRVHISKVIQNPYLKERIPLGLEVGFT